jgi:hypothetical protein
MYYSKSYKSEANTKSKRAAFTPSLFPVLRPLLRSATSFAAKATVTGERKLAMQRNLKKHAKRKRC